ncbi:aldehyde ferredoxin oxidoreductase family protein [Chloroflexota bacterium]
MSKLGISGYTGKLLRVDLTEERLTEESLDEVVLRKYVGGTGFGLKILYEEVPPHVQWSDPENRLTIASGPLGGTRIPGSGAYSVVTKGCLTNGAVASQANGFFGAYMRFSGFDGIVLQGAATQWLYLYLHDGIAELRDASHLQDKDTWETEDLIKEELGYTERQMSVICIGPAGENLVKFAAICGDKGHVAGHNGTGAVMGSKKLKAIAAARGKDSIRFSNKKRLSVIGKQITERARTDPARRQSWLYGTLPGYRVDVPLSCLPIKNYTTNIYPNMEKLEQFSPEYIRGRFSPKHTPCWACQRLHCHMLTITEGPYEGMTVEEPEHECFSAMGAQIGNMEVASAMMLSNVVDRVGLEMNETGWLMGLAIECYEKGLINKEGTEGIALTWGNVEAVRTMLYKIANREGIGDVLAEGTMRAAQRIGGEAPNFAVHTMKGNTPRGYDHRAYWTEMFDKITSSTSTLEARPLDSPGRGYFSPARVPEIVAGGKARMSFWDTLCICFTVSSASIELVADAVSAATGWDFTAEEATQLSLRIVNQMKVYNILNGHTRELDAPSPRYGSAPVDGIAEGVSIMPMLDQMLDEYYQLMGWDKETGKPLPDTLRKLGLEHIIKDIW